MKWNLKTNDIVHLRAFSCNGWTGTTSLVMGLVTSLVVVAALCLPGSVAALATDSQQPIEIEADFAELDDLEGRTIYVGNVIVIQGSIRMTGDKLTVLFDEAKELKHLHMEGQTAYFKQTPDGGKEDIEGEGLIIEYLAQESMLHLIQKAVLTQGARVFTGDRINYDSEKSVLTGRIQPEPDKTAENPPKRGRVKTIIPPKKKVIPAIEAEADTLSP
jgi:lipopolysaccharide export system protein LptA